MANGFFNASERPDNASFRIGLNYAQLASIESPDIPHFGYNTATFTSAESPDVVRFVAGAGVKEAALKTTELRDQADFRVGYEEIRLAAIEPRDTAHLTVGVKSIAATFHLTDRPDSTYWRVGYNYVSFHLRDIPDNAHPVSATFNVLESPDDARFRIGYNNARLVATDPTDDAHFGPNHAHLAVTEPTDMPRFLARDVFATLRATEHADYPGFVFKYIHNFTLLVTEPTDSARFRLGNLKASLSATDARDTARFNINQANGARFRLTEAPDTAQFRLRNNNAYLQATDPVDVPYFRLAYENGVYFAITEPADGSHWIAYTGNFVILDTSETPDHALFKLTPPPEPPCEPVWTRPLEYYLSLITSEHNQKPKYMTTVESSIDPIVHNEMTTADLPCLFDVDIAVGEQLDYTGQWVGKTRWIELPNVFFTWDAGGLGWDQAYWKGPYDSENAVQRLDDQHYRLLLYATIVANHWNGSIPDAYRSWDIVFAPTGFQVVIQDWGDMTMAYGLLGPKPIDAITQSLFMSGEMDLKPEGVVLSSYIFQEIPGIPFFGFDGQSNAIAGWDKGQWGILVPPGQGFVPGGQIYE